MFNGTTSKRKGAVLNYYPLQPKLKSISHHYMDFRGHSHYNILLFYQFKMAPSDSPVLIFPDGCIEILFYCNPNKPTASIYGSLLNSRPLSFGIGYEHFGVRLLPEQASKLVKYPLNELTDKKLPFSELVLTDHSIVEKICAETSLLK